MRVILVIFNNYIIKYVFPNGLSVHMATFDCVFPKNIFLDSFLIPFIICS